jgi:Plasmid replication region DNA-binding N-term
MARAVAISEQKWLEMADELAANGGEPTVRGLAALARDRFGLSGSFTTIQALLDSWRRMGGPSRPISGNPSFVALIQRAAEPLYQQLLDDAAAKYDPLLIAAEARLTEANKRCEKISAQLEQTEIERGTLVAENLKLHAEINRIKDVEVDLRRRLNEMQRDSEHLQNTMDAAIKRWAEGREDYLARIRALESHNALLLKARSDEDDRYHSILTTIQQMRVGTHE